MLINVSSTKFIQLYIVDYHVVERALKERYLTGQSVRAVIFVDIEGRGLKDRHLKSSGVALTALL